VTEIYQAYGPQLTQIADSLIDDERTPVSQLDCGVLGELRLLGREPVQLHYFLFTDDPLGCPNATCPGFNKRERSLATAELDLLMRNALGLCR
jgi:hypothetical protein